MDQRIEHAIYKKYKNQTYEGGISAPLIAFWPDRIKKEVGKLNKTPFHTIDLMKTVCDAGGATYPSTFKGNKITPTEGISMLPTFIEGSGKTHEYFYWEHEGHCAVRYKNWKIVKPALADAWELYDLTDDRTERTNVAHQHQDIVKKLDEKWETWANSHQVFPKGKDFQDNVANHFNKYAE
ncbi:arylsulfatase A-like enzyme [Pedobacter sp. UYP30]|uniref:sulfatase family protein n=1 Tax=Pedobacter sp. UYP30 TaxID=1756400 RepID=UPI0033989F10